MSRVGKLEIAIPSGVDVKVNNLEVVVSSSKGQLNKLFKGDIDIIKTDSAIKVQPKNDSKHAKEMWGTARNIINNMILGVTNGFNQKIEVKGVGYRAAVKSNYLALTLGKSHNTMIEIPKEINVNVPKQDQIELSSIDKEKLGSFVAILQNQRKPEPYKGKGIRKEGQYIISKEGKKG